MTKEQMIEILKPFAEAALDMRRRNLKPNLVVHGQPLLNIGRIATVGDFIRLYDALAVLDNENKTNS